VWELWADGEWDIQLRSLHGNLLVEWNELQSLIKDIQLDASDKDDVRWAIEKSQVFSTNL
jgi:hypothetical protein